MYTGTGFPSVIGFDLPGLRDGPATGRVIVSALLDAVPRGVDAGVGPAGLVLATP